MPNRRLVFAFIALWFTTAIAVLVASVRTVLAHGPVPAGALRDRAHPGRA